MPYVHCYVVARAWPYVVTVAIPAPIARRLDRIGPRYWHWDLSLRDLVQIPGAFVVR